MMLRSPWRATHFSDPGDGLSLDNFAAMRGIDSRKLLPLEDFVAYGEWFQQRAAPDVDRRTVRKVDTIRNGFRLTLEDGAELNADRVIVATGLRNQEYRPPVFCDVPDALVSHSSQHTDLAQFRGKRVAVIGRGQSACESAALLAEAGADVEIITRGPIHWLGDPSKTETGRPLRRRLRKALASPSEVGPFPLSWLVETPGLVRYFANGARDEFTRRCLKPAASGWLRPRFADVGINPARNIAGARVMGEHVVLDLDTGAAAFDHVLLGTGYRIDIARLGLLTPHLLNAVSRVNGSPLLGSGFQSSVPKLHFVGSYAVHSFGPLLRFIAGASYAAQSVAAAVRRSATNAVARSPSTTLVDAAVADLS
jgi:cation diffusion facilitator CzcD-associated flavoprotein CzcO